MNVSVLRSTLERTALKEVMMSEQASLVAPIMHDNYLALPTLCLLPVDATKVERPAITQPPQEQSVVLVQAVNLTVKARGNPPPSYQWFRDGVEIPEAILPYLYIREVTPGDRGNYTCTATNQEGSVVSSPGLLSIEGCKFYVL